MHAKLNLAVIFGGRSSEYKISLQSAAAVLENLNKDKYDVHMLGITPTGQWFLYKGNDTGANGNGIKADEHNTAAGSENSAASSTSHIEAIANDTWRDGYCVPASIPPCRAVHGIALEGGGRILLDAAMPVLHGKYGEDGTVQGLLELAGIPIVGCGSLSSALCMDKHLAHVVAAAAGVAVPEGFVVDIHTDMDTLRKRAARLGYPLFVKPLRGGSSLGISCVHDATHLEPALSEALKYDGLAIIEQRVEGAEVGCSVLGGHDLTIGEVDEIEISGDFFDYTEKYSRISSRIHLPARIDENTAERIKDTAARIYRALGCSGFARVDMFLTPGGEVVFNEVNTIPGFTSHSRFPNMLKAIGYSFPGILDALIAQIQAIPEPQRMTSTAAQERRYA